MTKTYLGKLFAIFWILLGITLFSMLTATVTTEIINANSPQTSFMSGKEVGVLKDRIHDMSIVAHHGGVLHVGTVGHTMRGIDQLITMVQNKTVSGYLIDKNTYRYFNNRVKANKYQYIGERFERFGLRMTEKALTENHLKCGMLFKRKNDYEFFKGYLDNNRLIMHTCNDARMNTRTDESDEGSNFMTAESPLFKKVITNILIIVGMLVMIGLAIEMMRYARKYVKYVKKRKNADSVV